LTEKQPLTDRIPVGDIYIGGGTPLVLIAGPCVIEDDDSAFRTAEFLKTLTDRLHMPFVFKASFDKANRTSLHSFRGPGLDKGLSILRRIKETLGVPVLSDVHLPEQIDAAAEVLDLIQIPAFLCRQTDFIVKAAKAGKALNIKKGQFLAPWDVRNIVEKAESAGNRDILITERGSMFGYNNLVVDFRGIPIIQQETAKPVVFDATHSVQLPGGGGSRSGGDRAFAPVLARAAVAAGADGVFMEVHQDPEKALCDGPNSLYLDAVHDILLKLLAIRAAIRQDIR
jgi:2-dehydro-3-deoxyphosphooctonate aldolase (KDO 8-P synthase)